MNRALTKYLVPLSVIQLALQIIPLLWCGELDCVGAGKSEDGSSLVCIVLLKDASPTQDFSIDTSTACSCVCHLRALPGAENFTSYVKALTPLSAVGLYTVLDQPSEPIIRPPIAS